MPASNCTGFPLTAGAVVSWAHIDALWDRYQILKKFVTGTAETGLSDNAKAKNTITTINNLRAALWSSQGNSGLIRSFYKESDINLSNYQAGTLTTFTGNALFQAAGIGGVGPYSSRYTWTNEAGSFDDLLPAKTKIRIVHLNEINTVLTYLEYIKRIVTFGDNANNSAQITGSGNDPNTPEAPGSDPCINKYPGWLSTAKTEAANGLASNAYAQTSSSDRRIGKTQEILIATNFLGQQAAGCTCVSYASNDKHGTLTVPSTPSAGTVVSYTGLYSYIFGSYILTEAFGSNASSEILIKSGDDLATIWDEDDVTSVSIPPPSTTQYIEHSFYAAYGTSFYVGTTLGDEYLRTVEAEITIADPCISSTGRFSVTMSYGLTLAGEEYFKLSI